MVEDFYGENRKTIYKLVLLLGTYEKVIYKLHFLIFDGKVIDVFCFFISERQFLNWGVSIASLPEVERQAIVRPVVLSSRPSDGSQGNIERLGKLF